MKCRKSTKRALSTSLLALLLCVAMLVGTTFAWFTDSVTSGSNQITSGNLNVELNYMDKAGNWLPVQDSTALFDSSALWEPGYTEVVYLQVSNLGSLALKYQLGVNVVGETGSVNKAGEPFLLSEHIHFGVVEGVSTRYASRQAARDAVTTSTVIADGYSKSSSLYPAASGKTSTQYVALVVYMPEETGNVANHAADATPPSIELGVDLVATQEMEENDSFGNDYDEDADYPALPNSVSVTIPVTVTNDGKLANAVDMANEDGSVYAHVPAGVQLADGVNALTFSVDELEESEANITLDTNEKSLSLNVHVEGLKETNDVPIAVTIEGMLPTGLNMGNYDLYHVEDGATNTMTLTATPAAHNEYSYDPATGDVTMMLKSFSEVTTVVNTTKAWSGDYADVDYSWYTGKESPYTISNADQLIAFSNIVGGMDGQTQDTFEGKTVYLGANINLDDTNDENGKVFYPIGYHNSNKSYKKESGGSVTSSVAPFMGTFDGRGFTISNFYQNTWEMFGDYNDGYSGTPNHYKDAMGLFGYVYNGTVKNLTVKKFSSDGEFTPTGVIAAYAAGVSKFENIAIIDCNPRVYNTGNGGIVGIGGNTNEDGQLSFKNITIDKYNKITALWGSWDVACGGVIGMFRGNGGVDMDNCHVAAQIDVNNDVCGNYQYYRYRYAGMLIGTNKNMKTENGITTPVIENFKFTNCSVHFDSWNDYWYCELVANSLASYTHDHQFSRLTVIDNESKIKSGDTWTEPGNFLILGATDKDHKCYHIMKDADGNLYEHKHSDSGKETVDDKEVLKEDKQIVYLPFDQLLTGYGWGVNHIPVYKGNTELYFGDNVRVIDETKAESKEKFACGDGTIVVNNDGEDVAKYFRLGDYFKAVNDSADIQSASVMVSIEAVDDKDENALAYVFDRNETNWEDSVIKFPAFKEMTVRVTIQDYKYCTPTTAEITLKSNDKSNDSGFGGDWS